MMTETAFSSPSLDRLFLGRQPILDAQETLIGYELLFRDSDSNQAATAEPGMASADVVCKAFAEFGLVDALGGYKAFVIADAEFLRHEAIEVLPPDSVVFEVDARLAIDPEIVARCLDLADKGFAFCLTNPVVIDAVVAPLLKQSMFVKMNLRALDDAAVKKLLDLPADYQPIPIASHIETDADRQRAQRLGFCFFQGYYFARPTLVEGKKVDPATHSLMRILQLLNRDAELAEIERAFKGEAALTLKLLRLTNSVGVGLRVRIASVRQAINVIGRRQIQRWVQLLLFSHQRDHDDPARNPLMQLAAFKGNFMERLARHCYPQQAELPELCFLAGLMSLMPTALGMSMEKILEQIIVAPSLRQGLLAREGEIGLLLNLTDSYDSNDPLATQRILSAINLRIGPEILNQCLSDSMAWTQSLGVESV